MLYAAIDIHKRTFHAAVLDVESGETSERRDAGRAHGLGDAVARHARGGRDRGNERLAVGVAGAERARLRRAPGRPGAGEGVARPDQTREDRPSRCALAVCVAGEGDAARIVAAAGRDPDAARSDTIAEGARGGSHPLGATAACATDARGVAVPARAAVDRRRTPLGDVAVAVAGGTSAGWIVSCD
jgi:hypothetical protein